MATVSHIFAEIAGATLTGAYDDVTLNVSLITLDATNATSGVGFSASLNGTPIGSATALPTQIKTWTVPGGAIVLTAITGHSGKVGVRLPDGITLQAWTF